PVRLLRVQLAIEQPTPPAADVADPLLRAAGPGPKRRAPRIREQNRRIEFSPPQGPEKSGAAAPRSGRTRVVQQLLIEPGRAGQHVGDVGPHDADQPGPVAEMLA